MMDNYDRTMELVNVAYDSNGKATEQFGKYSDTLEYKLNQLTNTWEQMRLKFLNSEFLKSAVDQLTNLLKKFEDFNIKDIAVLVGVWLTFGKKAIQNFITGMQQSSAGIQVVLTKIMSKASNWISTQTSKLSAKYPKLFKIGFNTDEAETQLAEITKELNVLKNKIIEVDGQEITVGVALEGLSIDQMKNMVKQYEQEFNTVQQNATNLGYSSEEATQYASNAARNATGLTHEEFLAAQRTVEAQDLQNKIAERKKVMSASATAIGQSFGVAFTAAVTSVMTEASPGEAFGNIFISGLTAMIPQVISVATTMGAAAAAATGGISVAITLIVGAVTTLYSHTKKLEKEAIKVSYLSSTVGANQQAIENLTEQHEKLNDVYLEESDRLNELQNNYNDLETAIESYIDLNEQILLSTEEREELLSLEEDIASMNSELVDYYDSEGNAILKNTEYLKEYLELKKEEMLLQQQETLKAKNDVNVNEFRTAASENEIATEQRDFFNSKYAKQLMTRKWDADEGIGDTISAWVEEIAEGIASGGKAGKQAENDAHALMSAIKTYDEAWYNELTEGLAENDGVVNAQEFLKRYSGSIGDKGGGDSSNSFNEEYQRKLLKIQAAAGKEAQNTTSKLKEQKAQIDENYDSLVRLEMETDKEHTITNKNVQELIVSGTKAKIGIDGSLTDAIDADIRAAYKTWFSEGNGQGDILEEYIDEYNTEMANRMEEYSNKISSSYDAMVKNLGSSDISKLEKIYEDAENNGWNAIDILNQISTQFRGNGNVLGAAANRYSEQISQYNENLKDIANKMDEDEPTKTNELGMYIADPNTFTGWYTNLSSATQQAISTGINKASEIDGPEFGKQFAEDIKNAINNGTIDENIFATFQNSGVFNEDNSIFDIEKSKNKFIKDVQELGYSIDEAKFQWENLYAFSQSYGTINFKITTDAALEDMTNEVEDSLNTIVTSYDKVSSYLSTQLSEGGIDLSGFTALRDEVASIGLDIDNYVTGMQNGLYQINFDALTQAYHEQVDSQAITVEAVKAEIQARINAIDALLAENTSEVHLQNAVVDTTDAIWAQAEAMAEVANMAAKARAEQTGGPAAHYTVTRTNNVKKKPLSQEQRTALKQERDDLVDLMNNEKAMQEIADQRNAQQAAHAQISNKEADAIDKVTKANKGGSSAAKDAADAADKLREAQEKLNEALYGTENYKNAADHLANYTERLEELTEKADKAKESLENLGKEDSASELIATYAENVKLDNITRTAENQVLQQSIDDLLKILNEQYSEYFQKVGDTWMWNASVVDAKMNDHEKDFIIESIENLNEYQDKINENLDAIEEREKEFKEMRKTALDSRIALEEEVMDVLKENYQKEIDAAQEKYDALKEADDNYLDALEEAINKQRELRDRANQYEDLAQKERKLALKQRDTSGTNRKETLQLQKEVEDSRQEMLDNEVDRIIESMKEMYELQQESREAELEYMNAMMENGQLLQEANEIIASFSTREDMLAWFFENNKELADMSVAATEKYKMELEEMYDAAELYYAMSETNLEELTSFTEEEVSNTVATIGETLTLEAERSYNEMRETVEKEVEDARKAVEDAAKSSADAVGGAASAIGSAADYIKSKVDEMMNSNNTSTNLFDIATPTATASEEERKGRIKAIENGNVSNFKNDMEIMNGKMSVSDYVVKAKAQTEKQQKQAQKEAARKKAWTFAKDNSVTGKATDYARYKLEAKQGSRVYTYYFTSRDKFNQASYLMNINGIPHRLNNDNKQKYNGFLNGGLVDYTGPAWVDGTPSKPEAFLNSEDTKRIGEAAKLLSNLPILNSTSSASTQLSTNVGDTSIEIHINVESISSDYDVDRLAERIKSDIVDASKPVGTPVILKR